MSRNWAQLQDNNLTLRAIQDNNLIFVSAQPDTTYFHWQVEMYLYQFSKYGISNRCYALIGFTGDRPSDYAIDLKRRYPSVRFYKDERNMGSYKHTYLPTIRPHLLAKFFKEYPGLGRNVFYHDSDIFFVKLPRFEFMLQPYDKTSYVSNTISYIGYEYINSCSERYKIEYPNLRENDIFYGMCDTVGISYDLVINNQNNSGGAQYLLKNIDGKFWEECELKCEKLYDYLSEYIIRYPIASHIQKWTADMWVLLWLYWKRGGKTLIHKELDFSWGTSSIKEYNKSNIFHLAGVTNDNCVDKFYKGLYTKQSVFDAYIKDPKIFDHVSTSNATYEYVKVIKDYVHNHYVKNVNILTKRTNNKMMNWPWEEQPKIEQTANQNLRIFESKFKNEKIIKSFRIITRQIYAGVYRIDETTMCCDKNIWRSENNLFIIFWNKSKWILTFAEYESQIGPDCGGIISSPSDHPYINKWNTNDMIIKQ